MTVPAEGLERPCGTCGRTSGDHTLREWAECMGTVTLDLPYEDSPDDAVAQAAAASVRERFQIGEDVLVADHVNVRAATLAGSSGPVGMKLPALLIEFLIGVAGKPPVRVAEVAYLADAHGMGRFGMLMRDSANGAVRAAQR